jgi:predicted small metal-binding protein
MREFKCSSLGYGCSWKYIATEELLADMVALHLRDVHGVQAIDSDMVGTIKNLFSYPTKADAAEAADLVMKEYICELGPGCTWRYIAMTEDLITDGAAMHAREKHGIRDFSPEMMAGGKRSIRNWAGGEKSKAA